MAQFSTRRFHSHSTHCVLLPSMHFMTTTLQSLQGPSRDDGRAAAFAGVGDIFELHLRVDQQSNHASAPSRASATASLPHLFASRHFRFYASLSPHRL